MKRVLSIILAAIMLVSSLVITTGAKGTLVTSDNFDEGFLPRNWITAKPSCEFSWDKFGKCIIGYNDAVVLQSNFGNKFNRWWDSFYGKIDFQIRDFDDYKPEHEGREHTVSLWYRDRMTEAIPAGEQCGAVYVFEVTIETGKAHLRKEHTWDYYDAAGVKQSATTNVILAEGQINTEIEVGGTAPFYELGWRIGNGKIECYFEQELVCSAEADPTDPKLGLYTMNSVDESVGSTKGAFLVWNGGNFIALDNFEIWSYDYDFAAATAGDVNNDGDVNLSDVSKMLQFIAKWELADFNEAAADVNADAAVNLSDVTKVLQFIAKWEGVVLG